MLRSVYDSGDAMGGALIAWAFFAVFFGLIAAAFAQKKRVAVRADSSCAARHAPS